jgi:hypothetical protein
LFQNQTFSLNNNIFFFELIYLKEEGFLRFFDGLSLRLGRKTIQAAINWTIYEALVTWFQQRKKRIDNIDN